MPYLAMTAAELRYCHPLPEKIAWMACHFSPYGTGLTNLPKQLPPGSLLILNDRTPVRGHDPAMIRDTLMELTEVLCCRGLLLDFQREKCSETDRILQALLDLPCPVCVSEAHAQGLDCPVFLPPVPLLLALDEYISPWQGREIWLEVAQDSIAVALTDQGSTTVPLPQGEFPDCPHYDEALLCHYCMELHRDSAVFTLRRTKEDLSALMEQSKHLGVTCFVGLWQELGPNTFPTGSSFNRCGSALGFTPGEGI